MHFENVIIKGIGKYIPERVVNNEFLIQHFKQEKYGSKEISNLLSKLGREKRHFADMSDTSLTMAVKAALNTLENAEVSALDIDAIIFVSDTPEYTVPSNAVMIHHYIGADNASIVFDMNCNCTGMIVAIDTVSSILRENSNINTALVIGSFHASSVVRWDDAFTYGTFGDASVGVVLSKTISSKEKGFVYKDYYTDSNYYNYSRFPACGNTESLLCTQEKQYRRLEYIPFDAKLFIDRFTITIRDIFEKFNISDDDIVYYAFSQLSDSANKEVFSNLGIEPNDKYLFVATKYGYTGNTSPLLALSEVWDGLDFKANKGKYIIIISVAVGFSVSAVLYKV